MKQVATFLIIVFIGFASQAKEIIHEQLPANSGETLTVRLNTGGSVHVETWSENTVDVVLEILTCEGGECDYSIERSKNGVEVRTTFTRRNPVNSTNLKLRVKVPEAFHLDIVTAGGSVFVYDLQGNIKGRSGGGSLVLSGTRGNLDLTLGGGSIELSNVHASGRVSTGGGSLRASGIDGQVSFSTGGGSVSINQAVGAISVRTGGGSIKAEQVAGIFSAATGAGNISVSLAEEAANKLCNLRLSSGYGKVFLSVPTGFSTNILAELTETDMGRNIYNISSDIPLTIEKKRNSASRGRDSHTTTTARLEKSEISNTLVIKTTNGDINIRRQ